MAKDLSIRYGRARTGRVIDSLVLKKIKSFSADEIFDAYALFSYLSIRELRKYRKTQHYYQFERLLNKCHKLIIQKYDMEILMAGAYLKSVFDVRAFGKSLAFIEFRDP